MAWTTPKTWTVGEVLTASDMNTYVRDNLVAAAEGLWLIDIDVFPTAVDHTNFDTVAVVDSNYLYQGYKSSSGAQNAEISWDVVLTPGTWTIELLHTKDTSLGIYSVQLDGVEQGTVDGYDSSTTHNQRGSVTGIVIAAAGKVRLTLKMATKNASASGYGARLQHVQLRRTA